MSPEQTRGETLDVRSELMAVTWKVHAGRAQLKRQMGDPDEAQKASERATEIVNYIASNVSDEKLRHQFLHSTAKLL